MSDSLQIGAGVRRVRYPSFLGRTISPSHRASELLYPPVQVGHFFQGEKRRQIISVGRFFVEGHSKKQLHMIELFKRLCDGGLVGWEYHIVGGTSHDPIAARYLERCREAAVGTRSSSIRTRR